MGRRNNFNRAREEITVEELDQTVLGVFDNLDDGRPKWVPLADLDFDETLQMRVGGIDKEHLKALIAILEADGDFDNPGEATRLPDGIVKVTDGFHRGKAKMTAGHERMLMHIVDGTMEDAIRRACFANLKHGLILSNDSKKRVLQTMMELGDWANLGVRVIAKELGVSHMTVSNWRIEIETTVKNFTVDRSQIKGADGRTYNTEKIAEAAQNREKPPTAPDFKPLHSPGQKVQNSHTGQIHTIDHHQWLDASKSWSYHMTDGAQLPERLLREAPPETKRPDPKFKVGDQVLDGVIQRITQIGNKWVYEILRDDKTLIWDESQIIGEIEAFPEIEAMIKKEYFPQPDYTERRAVTAQTQTELDRATIEFHLRSKGIPPEELDQYTIRAPEDWTIVNRQTGEIWRIRPSDRVIESRPSISGIALTTYENLSRNIYAACDALKAIQGIRGVRSLSELGEKKMQQVIGDIQLLKDHMKIAHLYIEHCDELINKLQVMIETGQPYHTELDD